MLVNEHPARAALLPNPRVPEFHLSSLTVFRFFRQMHRHRRPRDLPRRFTFRSLPAVSLISDAPSRNSFCTPSWYSFQL